MFIITIVIIVIIITIVIIIIIPSDEGDDYILLNTMAEYLVSENPTTGDLRFITVRIIDDDNYEGNQTFMMMFTASSPAITMGGSAFITIQDNEGI